ncbi:MAG: type I restriction enzyme HsdR N-terminal domain-containing protein, partial [Ignavibacteria bacterium]|nr:type I restriction enzyme HsdR N-terminal domain-containing protein [Ignavibacteria bacterium]
MTAFESAFEQVKELVNDFKENEQRFLSQQYQEAEVRRDYIDKFFEALGWDVYHKEQKNPYEQEVKVEKGISIGKAQKRADYAFYIAPEFRDPKFFTEAKKPSRNLKNADDYFQTIRYGWNANTPVAVLTDFQEFHILDCRFKPDVEFVLQNQNHKSYSYTDYSDSEKFKEIYYLFSRSEVENGSLQKYSESLPKPKGKSAKKGIFPATAKPIDEDFLEYIDDVRETLAKAFKKNDASLTSEQLTEVTQKTVDRLVFIRFLEDKLIEPEYYISELGKKSHPWREFISLCRKLDAKYNGIVFKETTIDRQNFKGPEEAEFLSICDGISRMNSPYDFHY